MGALTQTVIVGLIVLAALGYVTRRVWATVAKAKREKASAGCGDGCCK